jgi:hypothetical protein
LELSSMIAKNKAEWELGLLHDLGQVTWPLCFSVFLPAKLGSAMILWWRPQHQINGFWLLLT